MSFPFFNIFFINKKKFFLNKKINVSMRIIKNGGIKRKNFTRESKNNQLIFIISLIGMAETFYLSFSKVKNSSVICEIGNCSNVLNSVFSEFFQIPNSFFGFLFYFFIFFYIFNQEILKKINFFDNFLLFFGILGIYFVFILEFILKIKCQWCLLSILFTSSLIFNATIKQNYHFTHLKITIGIAMTIFIIALYTINFLEIYFLY